jgi:hypothetical protein
MTLDVEARAVELAGAGAAALFATPSGVAAAIRTVAVIVITAGKRTSREHDGEKESKDRTGAHAA